MKNLNNLKQMEFMGDGYNFLLNLFAAVFSIFTSCVRTYICDSP